ncbi:hypothetical protein RQCS_61890 (plasmid) [Rhodococcus qingshengii]|nr:hypothetical protein RQCS_61890 [Rhodococcus qingshengii]
MVSVEQQVKRADSVICQDIARPVGDRGFLSRNVLGQLRNLVEGGLIVWALKDRPTASHFIEVRPGSMEPNTAPLRRLLFVFSPREENVG